MLPSVRASVIRVPLFALLFLSASLAASSPSPEPAPRIVAFGDIHGDYTAFETVLKQAALVDSDGDWAAGKTILIQTGDIADRGPDTRRIIAALRELQAEAALAGGQVIALVGNHEAMVMTGDYRYLHPGEIAAFVDAHSAAKRDALWDERQGEILAAHREIDPTMSVADIKTAWEERTPLGLVELERAWAPDGEIGSWVKDNPVAVVMADSLFVHGGLSAKYADQSVAALNAAAAGALSAQTRDRSAIIHDPLGPPWYRGLLRGAGERAPSGRDGTELSIEAELDQVLTAMDVDRIFVGHTPSIEGVKCNHACRVIQIDTGMSAHYGGVIAFIEITQDGIFATNDGVRTRIEPQSSGPACLKVRTSPTMPTSQSHHLSISKRSFGRPLASRNMLFGCDSHWIDRLTQTRLSQRAETILTPIP